MPACNPRVPQRAAASLLAAVLGLACAGVASALPSTIAGWSTLPAQDRELLTTRAARLAAMTPAQRQTLIARVAEWHALPGAVRAQRREAWRAVDALPHAERMRLQTAATRYAALPEDERKALRARFDAVDRGMQRGWLLGPELGAAWPGLHALFAAMPAAQQDAVVLALRAMSAQARDDLAVLALRTPPQAREALRHDWLSIPAEQRDAWLRDQVNP